MFGFWLSVSQHPALEPFREPVKGVLRARQQQSTQSPLLGREDSPSLANDWVCAHPGVILVIFAKSPSSQSGQVKTLTCGLIYWTLRSFFLLTFQFSATVSVATSGTSSLDEEVFSAAFQSNGNDCAPGETENCICVLEWSAVMRLRGRHAWKSQGAVSNSFFLPCWDTHFLSFEKKDAAKYSTLIQFELWLTMLGKTEWNEDAFSQFAWINSYLMMDHFSQTPGS